MEGISKSSFQLQSLKTISISAKLLTHGGGSPIWWPLYPLGRELTPQKLLLQRKFQVWLMEIQKLHDESWNSGWETAVTYHYLHVFLQTGFSSAWELTSLWHHAFVCIIKEQHIVKTVKITEQLTICPGELDVKKHVKQIREHRRTLPGCAANYGQSYLHFGWWWSR